MTKAEADRRARGDILDTLRRMGCVNPPGISHEGLQKIFQRAGRLAVVADMEEHIAYLKGKGYLDTTLLRDEISGVERWVCWISPTGIDLLNGHIADDPGVFCVW